MAKIIAIDGAPLTRQPDGVSVYSQQIVKAMLDSDKALTVYALTFRDDDSGKRFLSHKRLRWVVIPWPRRIYQGLAKYLGIYLDVSPYLKVKSVDLMLHTNFFAWPRVGVAKKSAVVIHDLAYIDYPRTLSGPNQRALKKLVPVALKRVDQVIAVSKLTAGRLKEEYRELPPVLVAPPAVGEEYSSKPNKSDVSLKKYGLPKNYILTLGTIEPRKNITGMINAYTKLPHQISRKYAFVIAGGKGWGDEEIQLSIDVARKSGFSILTPGKIAAQDLPALYRQAKALIFLSHYEGFGIPPLEAMACGTPTVVSSAVEEAVGAASIIVNGPQSASEALEKVLTNPEIRSRLVSDGKLRVGQFSWESSAKKVLSLI